MVHNKNGNTLVKMPRPHFNKVTYELSLYYLQFSFSSNEKNQKIFMHTRVEIQEKNILEKHPNVFGINNAIAFNLTLSGVQKKVLLRDSLRFVEIRSRFSIRLLKTFKAG